MNANLLVRKSNFLTTIKRTYVQLYTVSLFLLLTFGHQAFADDLVILKITDPDPVCSPATVNLTLPAVTAGSDADLVLSYYLDASLSTPIPDPTRVGAGVYYIVGIRISPFKLAALPVRVIVDPASAGGSVIGGSLICTGSTSGLLTLSGQVGIVTNWQSSVAPFNTWTNIANTATSYTSGILTQPTQFRAVIQSGGCPGANSTSTSVTISAATVGGAVSGGSNICFGSSSLLTLSGHVGTVIKWQGSVSPFTSWIDIANTSTTYNTGALVQTTQFRAVVQSGVCEAINSTFTTVTVDLASFGGSISGGSTICSGTSGGVLTLSGNVGSVLGWQRSVAPFTTWTDITNTSTTYSTGILTQTTQFRAVVQSGSCTSAVSTTGTITVSAASVGGTVSGGTSICIGTSSSVLTLSGNTGSVVKWQSSVSPFTVWTDIANTLITYTSGPLNETTQFRAVVQSGNCVTANSSSTTVVVVPVTQGGTVSGGTTVCFGSTSSVLTLSGHVGSIVNWQSSVAPFNVWTNIVNTATTYTSVALTTTTQFRAIVQSGTCAAVSSATTTVTVTQTVGTPVFALGASSGRCQGASSLTYDATATNSTGLTYSLDLASLAAGNSIVSTTGIVTFTAGWSGTSVITVIATGCNGPSSATHTVTVTSTPNATISYPSLNCSKDLNIQPVIFAGTPGGVFSSTAGLSINSSTGAISPGLSTAGTYTVTYFIAAAGGCSSFSTTTQVQISSSPSMETLVINNITCNGANDGSIVAKGIGNEVFTYSWTGPGSYSSSNASISGLAPGDYTVKLTNPAGCFITNTATLFEAAAISMTFIGVPPSKSGLSDGKIDVIISGGATPYTFNWTGSNSFTATTQNLTGLRFGTYNLVVTDKNNCSRNRSFVLNDPPTAVDDTTSTLQNIDKTINVVANDTDSDGTIDASTVDLNPSIAGIQTSLLVDNKGIFSVQPNGDVTFRPLFNFYGIVVIQYVVKDNSGLISNIANITINVKSTNLPPVAVNDTVTVAEHNIASGNLLQNDRDPEGKPLVIQSFTVASVVHTPGERVAITEGTIVVNLNGTFEFTPLDHYNGTVQRVNYTIVDVEGRTASAILIIIVTPVNDPPVAINDNFSDAKENTRYENRIMINDFDPKNNPIAVSIVPVQSPQHGTLELFPNGNFAYQPTIDFIGTDTFIYQLCNSLSLCSTATVTIVIAKDDSCQVFVPNVFTPNADGIHDYFKIRCLYNYENPEIQIFNRNGNLIFKKDHYGDVDFWGSEDQAYWNGRSQNKLNVINDELPVGTYYYVLKLGDGKVHAGFVFLAK